MLGTLFQSKTVFLEIGPRSLKILSETGGLELPIERQENGELSASSREQTLGQLKGFLQKKRWQRLHAVCAVSARGVALRRMQLPAAAKENLDSLLRLQIERELPLPPDQLAWGFHPSPTRPQGPANRPDNDLIVAAVKRDIIREYLDLLSRCGLHPQFTLGILAQSALCPDTSGSCALLDIGRTHSEWIAFEDGIPSSIRVIPWGGDNLTQAIQTGLDIDRTEAETLKIDFSKGRPLPQEQRSVVEQAIQSEAASLAKLCPIDGPVPVSKIYLTGKSTRLEPFPARLAEAIGPTITCEPVPVPDQEGVSAATLALHRIWQKDLDFQPLILRSEPAQPEREPPVRTPVWKWAALAVALALGSFFLRYAEPLLKMQGLSARLASLRTDWDTLPNIDRELEFLKFLRENHPPYLDAVTVIAGAAPRGMTVESLSMGRSGDLSLQGTMRNSQQAVEFRSKLIKSGFFETVVVQEQTPAERNQVKVRIVSRWKSAGSRPPTPAEFLPPDPEPTPDARDPKAAPQPPPDRPGKPTSSKPQSDPQNHQG